MEFVDIASLISRIEFKDKSYINFNMDDLSKIPFDKSYFKKGSPESKATDEMLANKYLAFYVKDGKKIPVIDQTFEDALINILINQDSTDKFKKAYQEASVAKKLMYSEASIMNTKIPTIIL